MSLTGHVPNICLLRIWVLIVVMWALGKYMMIGHLNFQGKLETNIPTQELVWAQTVRPEPENPSARSRV